jgi:catechol 2,3-dioxygenase-like lactoylglutathione lyase family enzyme
MAQMPDAAAGAFFSTAFSSTPRSIQFSHFGVNCWDLDRMEDFYTRVIGFVVTDRGTLQVGERIVFLSMDPNEHHQMVLVSGRTEGEVSDEPPIGGSLRTAIMQISFRLRDLDALRAIHERLKAEGFTNFVPRNHGIAWAVYVRDPEGNALELFVDSEWYVHQPFGKPLDLTQSNDTILAETERLCRGSPGFQPFAEFKVRVAQEIAAKLG